MSSAPQFHNVQHSSQTRADEPASPVPDARGRLVDGLREQLGRWGEVAVTDEQAVFSCGAPSVDRLLPGGGLRHGMLVEWLGARGGSGAATLGLLAAREACREGGVLVVIDRRQTFYPPAAAAWGIDLERLIVVQPQNARDELWAAVQSLRSPVVGAMWAAIDRLDDRAFRKLQLAAQEGRTLGALMRPASVRGQPSWADVTFEAGSLSVVSGPLHSNHGQRTTDNGRLVQIHMTRCHTGRAGGCVTFEIDDVARAIREVKSTHDAHPLPMVAELADPTDRSRSARA